MLHSFVFIALTVSLVAATTAPSGLACQTINITPSAGSVCPAQAWSICTTPAGASLAQAALQASWSSLTTQTTTATGNMACQPIGGTAIAAFWTAPSTWHCDANPAPCDATTCGTTAAPPTSPSEPYCCEYVRDKIKAACANVVNLDTLIAPGSMGNGTSIILSSLGLSGACSDTNCYSAAPQAFAYSFFAAIVAAILALTNL